jgi:kynurenine formamidase
MRFYLNENEFIETDSPMDLSMDLSDNQTLSAWYVSPPKMEVVRENGFLGSVEEGGDVNFRSIWFNPHGHGTHTESLGHITKEILSINKVLKNYFFRALLISLSPVEQANGDRVISIPTLPEGLDVEALIIRTLPNSDSKKSLNYADTNPPFLALDGIKVLNDFNIKHLLIDLPSVDKEKDGGALAFHHAFWEVPHVNRIERTITELIFVDERIIDGEYILELQVAPFENDASPSRPVLYKINQVK